MNKINNLFFFLIFIFLANCSFDDKTGIWSGGKDEKRRISELEKNQNEIIDIKKIYTSDTTFSKEINLSKKIILNQPKKNSSWKTSNLNLQKLALIVCLDQLIGILMYALCRFLQYPKMKY